MRPHPQTSTCPKPYSLARHAIIHVHEWKDTNSGCPDQLCTTTSEKIAFSNRLQQYGGVMSKLPAMAFRHQGLRITRAYGAGGAACVGWVRLNGEQVADPAGFPPIGVKERVLWTLGT